MDLNPLPISVIIPTIGRPDSLSDLFSSLSSQSIKVLEVIVADGSDTNEIRKLCADSRWVEEGLKIRHIFITPPNAVKQRKAAIKVAQGEYLLLLDDDVVLESECVERLFSLLISDSDIVGTTADFSNQDWAQPTRFWRFYLRSILRLSEGTWQGKVVGPLLRYGYNPSPSEPRPMDWLGSGNSLIRRSAYIAAGGFSDFFLYRCTINEDVDLGLKLRRIGSIWFCPAARMAHYHAPHGRVSDKIAAEDDLFNRYLILHHTKGLSAIRSFGLISLYFLIETLSNFLGSIKRRRFSNFRIRLNGRLQAIKKILILASR